MRRRQTMRTWYRTTWPPRPGFEDRPHRAVSLIDMPFEDAIAWALKQYDPFQQGARP